MMKAIAALVLTAAAFGLPSGAAAGDDGDAAAVKRSYRFEWKAPFTDMSPEGMAIIGAAMKRDRIPANAEEIRRARQRVLELLAAERLDVDAIRRAQSEERSLAIKEHERSQERMLRAYRQLSLDDRRAFAAGMRMQEERMAQHLLRARERMRRMQEQMQRDIERVKKETGSLWIYIPAPVEPIDGRG